MSQLNSGKGSLTDEGSNSNRRLPSFTHVTVAQYASARSDVNYLNAAQLLKSWLVVGYNFLG